MTDAVMPPYTAKTYLEGCIGGVKVLFCSCCVTNGPADAVDAMDLIDVFGRWIRVNQFLAHPVPRGEAFQTDGLSLFRPIQPVLVAACLTRFMHHENPTFF